MHAPTELLFAIAWAAVAAAALRGRDVVFHMDGSMLPANVPTPGEWFGGVLTEWEVIEGNTTNARKVMEAMWPVLRDYVHVVAHGDSGLMWCCSASATAAMDASVIQPVKLQWSYMFATKDGKRPMSMGQYGRNSPVILGLLVAVRLHVADASGIQRAAHDLLVTMDRKSKWHVYKHAVTTFEQYEDGCASPLHTPPPPPTLAVVSFNIWNYGEDLPTTHRTRLDKLLAKLKPLDPAIIALQEVRYDYRHHPQVDIISKALGGYQFVFQPAMSYPEQLVHRVEEGVAVFSRYPIVEHSYILLPRDAEDTNDFHQRICLRVRVLLPSSNSSFLDVFVTHLSLSAQAQERSVVAIWKFMRRFALQGVPGLLMGDLNAEPSHRAIQFLHGKIALEGGVRVHGLRDLWLERHPEPTSEGDFGYTFPASPQPIKRIDFIFSSNPNEIQARADPKSTAPSVALETVDIIRHEHSSLLMSDHHGLVARVKVL